MPDDKPEIDYLDYTSIRFPSDRLTLGTLRKVEPDKFDIQDAPHCEGVCGGSWEMVQAIMRCERELAWHAYEKAMGRPSPLLEGDTTRGDIIDELMELY